MKKPLDEPARKRRSSQNPISQSNRIAQRNLAVCGVEFDFTIGLLSTEALQSSLEVIRFKDKLFLRLGTECKFNNFMPISSLCAKFNGEIQ